MSLFVHHLRRVFVCSAGLIALVYATAGLVMLFHR
mgnify:FL=1